MDERRAPVDRLRFFMNMANMEVPNDVSDSTWRILQLTEDWRLRSKA